MKRNCITALLTSSGIDRPNRSLGWSRVSTACLLLCISILHAVEKEVPRARKVNERMRESGVVLQEILDAPDRKIPAWVLQRAHCAVIIPGIKKGAFFYGGHYGKGVVTCRSGRSGWTAPSTIRVEGASFGLQFGGAEIDGIIFIMNRAGREKLMKSRFTLGAEAGAMAGPVGRSTKAETDAFLHAKILSYSRARGLFAGAAIEGGTLRADNADNRAIYGPAATHGKILSGGARTPASARPMLSLLSKHFPSEL